jgi:hypothetical protein
MVMNDSMGWKKQETLNLKIIQNEILQKNGWAGGKHLAFAKLMVPWFWIQWGILKNDGSPRFQI